MLINRDERISRASPPRRAAWDAGPRRAPRNWFKVARFALYGLLGLLAGGAALAAAALLLGSPVTAPGPAPPPNPMPDQVTAPGPAPPPNPMPDQSTSATAPPALPDLPPAVTAPPPMPQPAPSAPAPSPAEIPPPAAAETPAPAAAKPAPAPNPTVEELHALQEQVRQSQETLRMLAARTPPTPPASPSDSAQLRALQDQIHAANATLEGLRAETEQIRRSLADAAHARVEQAKRAPPAPPPARDAGKANVSPEWADTERTIQALAVRPASGPAAKPAARPTPAPPPAPDAAGPAADEAFAANAPITVPAPAPGPDAPRPRVFLHYRSGSAEGLQATTDIAQRLLFSNFAYADTRSSVRAPPGATIRYYFPQDATAAQNLAALLGDTGISFELVNAAGRAEAKPGRLDVWVGR